MVGAGALEHVRRLPATTQPGDLVDHDPVEQQHGDDVGQQHHVEHVVPAVVGDEAGDQRSERGADRAGAVDDGWRFSPRKTLSSILGY